MSDYVVTNPKGVIVRTGPTTTAFAARTIASGSIIDIEAIVETLNETWGKLRDKERAFVAIKIGRNEYCAPLKIHPSKQYTQELDAWARSKGFEGIAPDA